MSIFILDPFSVATIENIDLIPTDVYQNITESIEFKCLVKAHYEKINEVKSNVTIHFTIATCFSFYYANILRFINILRFFFSHVDWNCGKLLLKISIVMNVLCKWMVHNHFLQFNCFFLYLLSEDWRRTPLSYWFWFNIMLAQNTTRCCCLLAMPSRIKRSPLRHLK